MSFDYESFMTGVITGLKLGRVPKGRTPPAPHGRYILTESGAPIITERESYPGVTVYTMREWYKTNAEYYSDVLLRGSVSAGALDPYDAFAINYNPDLDQYRLVYLVTTPIAQAPSVWIDGRNRTTGEEGWIFYIGVSYNNPPNQFFYSNISEPILSVLPSDGGILVADNKGVHDFLESLIIRPMITEGG